MFLTCQTIAGESVNLPSVSRCSNAQVVEVSGSESPSMLGWNARNHRARHDISRARLRAIESSLENGHLWVPPSPAHRKTWEEEVNAFPIPVSAFNQTAINLWLDLIRYRHTSKGH